MSDVDGAARPTAADTETPQRVCNPCGSLVTGAYCSACGARSQHPRLDTRQIAKQVFGQIVDLDLPLLRTAVDLTRDPGGVCRRYIDGDRDRYANPFKYCLLTTAMLVLVIAVFDVDLALQVSVWDAQGQQVGSIAEDVISFVERHYNLLILLAVPPLAVVTRALFRPAGLNFAEHYAFGLYVCGHMTLLQAVVAPFGVLGLAGPRLGVMTVQFALFLWAAKVCFRVSWRSAFWRAATSFLALRLLTVIVGILVAFVVVVLPALLAGDFPPSQAHAP